MKKSLIFVLMASILSGALNAGFAMEAKAADLTEDERDKFEDYLEDNLKEDFFSSKTQGSLYGASFTLADVNDDGHDDLVITGALGLRTMTFSEVYMHIGNKYVAVPINGTISKIDKNSIYVTTEDYEQAGAIRYSYREVFNISKKGKVTCKLAHKKSVMYYDVDKEKEYPEGRLLSRVFYKDEKKVKKATYKAELKKYSFKKLKFKEINEDNIEEAFDD